jgi:type I restriction enzyme S subunit
MVRPRPETEGIFVKRLFDSVYAKSKFAVLANGLTRVGLGQYELDNIEMPFPPPEEQSLITGFLDRETAKIDELVVEQQKLIELLKEKRQAVISHAVTKGLNPNVPLKSSEVAWIGDIPTHWGCAALNRIASRVVVGIAEAATHAYAEKGIPILRSTNIRPGKIIGNILFVDAKFAGDRITKLMNAGDLVTVRTGNAGVTAVIPRELEGCQCFTMLITTLNEGSIVDYYCNWMNSVAAQCYFSLEGWGTAQINISVPILKALPVPMPPASEQKEIVAFLKIEIGRFDTLTAQAQRAIELLQERRTALISAAVTGQIDVRPLLEKEAS